MAIGVHQDPLGHGFGRKGKRHGICARVGVGQNGLRCGESVDLRDAVTKEGALVTEGPPECPVLTRSVFAVYIDGVGGLLSCSSQN